MRILVCPASFKGSLSAREASMSMERGVRKVWPDAETLRLPVADGGEGLVEALVDATGGRRVELQVTGPLGEPVPSFFGILGDGATAVVEMAAAAGLPQVPPGRRDPRVMTTYGVGELIRAALDYRCRRVVIGLGGSATNDGGAGMAEALGARLTDAGGVSIRRGGAALAQLAGIDLSGMDSRISGIEFIAASDVTNPLTGPEGAAAIFGPQKGATPAMIPELDAALAHFGSLLESAAKRPLANLPGAGAAGGLGAGVMGFLGARLMPGIEMVIEAIGLRDKMPGADLVLVGEGRLDNQTAMGKAPAGVSRVAREFGVPVLAVGGSLASGCEELYGEGILGMTATAPGPISLEEAMARADELVGAATERLLRIYQAGLERKR